MAGPGKPGPPARGIERFQHEENMSLAVELYVGGATYASIAEAVGWADRSVAKRCSAGSNSFGDRRTLTLDSESAYGGRR